MSFPEDGDLALKILHTADWHLGRRFPAFDEADGLKLTRARLDAVGRAMGVADSYGVDAVLAAGDLFDDPRPGEDWWRGLLRIFESGRAAGRPVFLLPGNHDPLEAGSVYTPEHPFRRALPDHVHVVDRDDYEFALSDDAVLYAVPCRSQAGAEDPVLRLPPRADGDRRIRIGLVHGQTFDVVGHQTNFPIARDAAERRGLDYLALGDTHGFRDVDPKSRIPTVYPGAPEATRFGEQDAGKVAVVFFPRSGRPMLRPEPVGSWHWRDETCESLDALERLRTEELNHTVLRLSFDMRVDLPGLERAEAILTELKGTEAAHGRAGVLQLEGPGPELDTGDVDAFAGELPDVLRAVVEKLKEKEHGPEGRVARRAIYHLYRSLRRPDAPA